MISNPILIPLNLKDVDKRLLEVFYEVDLPCPCPDEQRREALLSRGASPHSFLMGGRGKSRRDSSTAGLCPGKRLDAEGWLLRHFRAEVLRTLVVTVLKTAPPSPHSLAWGKEEEHLSHTSKNANTWLS